MGRKTCSKCGEIKLVSEFSKDKQKKDGLRSSCKDCSHKQNNPEFYKIKTERQKLIKKSLKRCSKCNQVKTLAFFYKNKRDKDGYNAKCIDCIIPNSKEIENKRLFKEGKRRCSVCKEILQVDQFHKQAKTKTKAGLRTVCKQCRADRVRVPGAREEKKKNQSLAEQGFKKCTKCHQIKPIDQFYKRHGKCKICSNEVTKLKNKEHYEKNKQIVSAKIKEINNKPSKSKTFLKQLLTIDSPSMDSSGFITAECYKCHKRFRPKRRFIINRIGAIKGTLSGERNLYCSKACKEACPTYGFQPDRQTDPRSKLYVPPTEAQQARIAQTDRLKKKQCEEHGYNYCEKCGDIINVDLHHTLPVSQYGLEATGEDSQMLLCVGCHMELHRECV